MKPEISILMPGIRPERWTSVYSSILESTKREFELIIVGPYALPKELQEAKNVRYCKDFGTPMRAANIAGVLAEGKLIFSLMSDDSIFMPNVLDKAIDYLYEQEFSIKNAVMAFYKEGKYGTDKDIQSLEYFKINGSDSTKIYDVPNDWLIFNTVILYREFFDQLGGWDCSFEACPMGLTDFAIRAQKEGAKVFHIKYRRFIWRRQSIPYRRYNFRLRPHAGNDRRPCSYSLRTDSARRTLLQTEILRRLRRY